MIPNHGGQTGSKERIMELKPGERIVDGQKRILPMQPIRGVRPERITRDEARRRKAASESVAPPPDPGSDRIDRLESMVIDLVESVGRLTLGPPSPVPVPFAPTITTTTDPAPTVPPEAVVAPAVTTEAPWENSVTRADFDLPGVESEPDQLETSLPVEPPQPVDSRSVKVDKLMVEYGSACTTEKSMRLWSRIVSTLPIPIQMKSWPAAWVQEFEGLLTAGMEDEMFVRKLATDMVYGTGAGNQITGLLLWRTMVFLAGSAAWIQVIKGPQG